MVKENSNKKQGRNLWVSSETHKKVRLEAAKRDISMISLVENILKKQLGDDQRDTNKEKAYV